eukprot:766086-Hanusia_phi.AAC.1
MNCKNQTGMTPLHVACIAGKPKSAFMLLRCKADPGIKDAHGHTALDIARFRRNDILLSLIHNSQRMFQGSMQTGALMQRGNDLPSEEQQCSEKSTRGEVHDSQCSGVSEGLVRVIASKGFATNIELDQNFPTEEPLVSCITSWDDSALRHGELALSFLNPREYRSLTPSPPPAMPSDSCDEVRSCVPAL